MLTFIFDKFAIQRKLQMNNNKFEQLPFSIFPERRLYEDFPWQIWAIGILCLLKSVVWLATDPLLSEEVLYVLFYKYLLFIIPLIVFGIGVWNLRKWATIGLTILCIVELLFYIIYPVSLKSFYVGTSSLPALVFSAILFIFNW